jgi:large subunit ribosomal protein L13
MKFIDADGAVLGRLASEVAKRLLNGEDITVVNAEKALITGSKENVMFQYKQMRFIGSTRKGPFFPRMPDRILRRTVRGMLPFTQYRGRAAYKRLKVFIGVPRELGKVQTEKAGQRQLQNPRYIPLGEVSRLLGAKF